MNINPVSSAPPVANSQPPANVPTRRDLINAVKAISATDVFGNDRELAFVLDRSSQEPVMRVIDRKTNEVVMQVPAAYLLQIAKELKQKR